MAAIRIDRFQGLAPRFNRRQIPVGAAQIARNLRYDSGDLRPFQQPKSSGLAPLGAGGADIGEIFWYRFSGDTLLIPFGRDFDVTAGRSPVPSDQYRRWYWNERGEGLFGISLKDVSLPYPNGAAVGNGSSYKPFVGYRIGVPAPQQTPTAAASQAELAKAGWDTSIAIASLSRTKPMTVNLNSADHGFETGNRVVLKVNPDYPKPGEDDDTDPDGPPPPEDPDAETESIDGQIWALDGAEAIVSGLEGDSFDLTGIDAGGFNEFTQNDLDNLQVKRNLVDSDLESRAYVYTYVTEFDEEGPPSEPSNIVDVVKEGVVNLEIGDISHGLDRDGGSRAYVNRIRIYRTVAGESATLYVLVGTLNFAGGASPDSDASWISPPSTSNPELAWSAEMKDPIGSVSLGEPLPSEGWYPPPLGLWGILQLPNGIMAGWRENSIYFSEPYLPHAWNPDYAITLDNDVVGAASFGNIMVAGTWGRPYMISGVDPSSMRDQKLEHHAPLMHPRAIADAGSGVIYSSSNGLVWAGRGGVRVLTDKWDEHDWRDVAENRTRLTFFDGYALLYAPGVDPLILSMVGETAEAAYLDLDLSCAVRRDNDLAIVVEQPVTGTPYRVVKYFDRDEDVSGDPNHMTGTFRSGMVAFHRPINVGVAQVLAEDYPLTLTIRYIRPGSYRDPVEGEPDLSVLAEHEYTVTGPEPFRLVSGFISREYEIEVETSSRVQQVLIGTSMDDIRSA